MYSIGLHTSSALIGVAACFNYVFFNFLRYEELLNSWLNSDSTPQSNQETTAESTDRGTPLTLHIPQWHDGTSIRPPVGADVIVRDGRDARGAGRGEETLSERLKKLKQQIALERQADELEELRLAQMLGL